MKKNATWNYIKTVVIDALLAIAALLLSYVIHEDFRPVGDPTMSFTFGIPILLFVQLILFNVTGIYKIMWRFAGMRDIMKFSGITVFSCLIFFGIHIATGYRFRYGTYAFMTIILLAMLLSERAMKKYLFNRQKRAEAGETEVKDKNVMIIGAGCAGNLIIQDVKTNANMRGWKIRCIVDDDKEKAGRTINGTEIVCGTDRIGEYVREYGVDTILFAIPSCNPERRKTILSECAKTGCKVMTMPSVDQMISIDDAILKMREIDINDLLGREPIRIDLAGATGYIKDKVVMVTGGGGSIGSELCRQLAAAGPSRLIIFDIYENNAYDIQNELLRRHPELKIVTLIGSVRDEERVDQIFEKYRPQIVFHAAAHKHVPLMEDSPNEAVKNNVFGTLNVVRAADRFGTERFVMISTDKAVNPTNVMGATKRICEMIVQTYDKISATKYVAVRFGNVLGSNGSVIPLFRKQIAEGGPVTVTHPDIIRYFMTIPEAVSLVLQAGSTAEGGEIFVLDMGKPVRILDLAINMIRLSGFTPYQDIDIVFTGLRQGEKLYEEMLMDEEGIRSTPNKLIHIGMPIRIDKEQFLASLEEMHAVMEDDGVDIRSYIEKMVPTYHRKTDNGIIK